MKRTSHSIATIFLTAAAVATALPAAAAERKPVETVAANPIHAEKPAEVVKDRLMAMCEGAFSTTTLFERSAQLDGAEGEDLVFDYGESACNGDSMQWCGSGGCIRSVWLSTPEGYREVYEGPGWSIAEGPAAGEIEIDQHGAACGVSGAQGCAVIYKASASGLQQVSATPLQP